MCSGCDVKLEPGSHFCAECGVELGSNSLLATERTTSINGKIAVLIILFLCLFLGTRSFAGIKNIAGTSQLAENEINDITKNYTSNEVALENVFESKANKFSVRYPADWKYTQPYEGTVQFSGKEGTPFYYTTVNIQTLRTKKSGGVYSSIEELINDAKKQALEQRKDIKFLAEGSFDLNTTENRMGMRGRYLVSTYTTDQGQKYEEMEFIFLRNDGTVFYTWGYSAPIDRFKIDYPITKAMFASWSVY